MADASIEKETRQFLPFLDLVGLQDLLLDDGQDAGQVQRIALPTSWSDGPARPAISDSASPFAAQAGQLVPVAAPAAPTTSSEGAAVPHGSASVQSEMANVSSAKTAPLQSDTASLSAVKAATFHSDAGFKAVGLSGGGQIQHEAKIAPGGIITDAGKTTIDDPDIRVSIDQDVDVDQDIQAEMHISGDVDVEISASSDIVIDQVAVIAMDVVLDQALLSESGYSNHDLLNHNHIDHDGIDDLQVSLDQDMDIDTLIHVDIRGFAGDVFIETRITDDIDVEQSARPAVLLDGDGEGFDLDISQLLDIDLLSDIDIDIREEGGRLFISVFVNDRADGTDITSVEVSDSADDIMDIELRQSIDIDQRVALHVDVEQELASLFDIDVDVDTETDVSIRQEATAGIGVEIEGEYDVALDGESEVQIVNQLNIRIDFSAA